MVVAATCFDAVSRVWMIAAKSVLSPASHELSKATSAIPGTWGPEYGKGVSWDAALAPGYTIRG